MDTSSDNRLKKLKTTRSQDLLVMYYVIVPFRPERSAHFYSCTQKRSKSDYIPVTS